MLVCTLRPSDECIYSIFEDVHIVSHTLHLEQVVEVINNNGRLG